MLALLSTLVFAAAATFAIAVLCMTMKGRGSQIAALLADYRSLKQDREFLIQVTGVERASLRPAADLQARRTARRAIKRPDAARSARSLRAAA